MPTHRQRIEGLRRRAVTTLTYALAVALVAMSLPAVMIPTTVAALLPEPGPVVARFVTPEPTP